MAVLLTKPKASRVVARSLVNKINGSSFNGQLARTDRTFFNPSLIFCLFNYRLLPHRAFICQTVRGFY